MTHCKPLTGWEEDTLSPFPSPQHQKVLDFLPPGVKYVAYAWRWISARFEQDMSRLNYSSLLPFSEFYCSMLWSFR